MLKVHMSLAVRNVADTSEFYKTLFQSEPVKTKNDYVKFEPKNLALNISFRALENGRAVDTNRHHLGIQFPSQVMLDQAFDRLQAANLVSGKRESSICCYADQDKFNVRDPDGYQWELYYLLTDSELKIEATTICCATDVDEGCASESGKASCCD